MTRQIFAAEISFDDIPQAVAERFLSSEKGIKKYLGEFREVVDEVYILGTPGRFTVYIVHDNLAPLTSFFYERHNLRGYVQLYYNTGESVAHLMAIASGLLSTVKGDMQALTDVMKCYDWAKEIGSVGLMLDHTIARTIEVGRRVRIRTGIDQFCTSLVDIGIELLYSRLENLHRKNIVIVGTGELAAVALELLTREGLTQIAVTGHNVGAAQRLAEQYSVQAFAIDALNDRFQQADVVIAVASCGVTLNLDGAIDPDVPAHGDRFVLDFGVPPNFDETQLERHCAEFYNIDDLRRLQPSPLEAFGGIDAAWRSVVSASNEFVHLLEMLNHTPILTAYLARQFQDRSKGRRSLRDFLFGRSARGADAFTKAPSTDHLSNVVAEDGQDVVRQVQRVSSFRYYLPEN